MADELNNQQEEINNNQYIDAINQLKQNTVDKEKYDQLKEENKRLLDSLVNGGELDQTATLTPQPTLEELRQAYLAEDQTNLSAAQNILKLRQAIMDAGQPDPFLPVGHQIMPTDQDVQTAEKVASVLEECIEYADGDSAIFTNELQRRLVDVKY